MADVSGNGAEFLADAEGSTDSLEVAVEAARCVPPDAPLQLIAQPDVPHKHHEGVIG